MKNLIRISDERSNLLDVVFLNVPPNIREITLRCTSLQHVLVGGEQVSFSAKAQDLHSMTRQQPTFMTLTITHDLLNQISGNLRLITSKT